MNPFFVEKLLATLLVAGISVLADPLDLFRKHRNHNENIDSRDKSPESEEPEDDDDDKDYLKGVYIAIGVLGAFLVVAILLCCICRRRKKKQNTIVAVKRPSTENYPIKPSAPRQLYSIANDSYTGPVRGTSMSSGTDFASQHSYQNVAYDNGFRDLGHMGMGPPPPYFEHEEAAPEYTPSVVTLQDTNELKAKQ